MLVSISTHTISLKKSGDLHPQLSLWQRVKDPGCFVASQPLIYAPTQYLPPPCSSSLMLSQTKSDEGISFWEDRKTIQFFFIQDFSEGDFLSHSIIPSMMTISYLSHSSWWISSAGFKGNSFFPFKFPACCQWYDGWSLFNALPLRPDHGNLGLLSKLISEG